MSGVMMVALVLLAVTVVTMSAPLTASRVVLHTVSFKPASLMLFTSFAVAAGSVSNRRISSMPTRCLKAMAWNSLCAPLPIRAITRLLGRARARAATAEVAAVRRAVVKVSSLSSWGMPVPTSANTPKAITVGKPICVFLGWPLTYLKL